MSTDGDDDDGVHEDGHAGVTPLLKALVCRAGRDGEGGTVAGKENLRSKIPRAEISRATVS